MMTSAQIRQSFLDFFKSKQHTIVPSSSLLPDSPNLLFTNAGMNQFVPIFLGQAQCPYKPGRAADTQKCIRAGGKHNDLEDVGLDTYHHTFFEMLGNWSFGNYFKKEAIEWAWELITSKQWFGFPAERLYATVYKPGPGEPSESDQEAYGHWEKLFKDAGLDPKVHVCTGGKKDNFWMMGDTGPCGPCSEIHVDLTPKGDTKGALVNKGDARCIEIWNLVFMQFNANADGTFTPLPAKNVDTGMGFERVTSIIQGTKGFKDFGGVISNYETDIFRPIFDALEKLSGKKYGSTLPGSAGVSPASSSESDAETRRRDGGAPRLADQIQIDIAFRVIADHIRTLSFAIADGIQPGNNDRNYVLRRILRRAVRYGRTLGFHEPFFYKLVDVLADTMGDVFPEIRARKKNVQDVIRAEEEAFNKTLDRGITLFEEEVERLLGNAASAAGLGGTGYQPVAAGNLPAAPGATYSQRNLPHFEKPWAIYVVDFCTFQGRTLSPIARDITFDCILHWRNTRYRLVAACVMPDHVHFIIQPGVKEEDHEGNPVFWPLSELLHSVKSFSANEINKAEKASGPVWQEERYDRYLRSDRDLEEKYHYVCCNPWTAGLVDQNQPWPWLWTQDIEAVRPYVQPSHLPYAKVAGQVARQNGLVARSTRTKQISGAFAFRLYDEQGFPLDLTELMARERGLTVDKEGFEKLMEEQRARARAAQKKEVISLSQIETTTPTKFVGYEKLEVGAKVLEVVSLKDKTAVILNTSACYAEMGGQVGDTGELYVAADVSPQQTPSPAEISAALSRVQPRWKITNTQKSGNTWLHFVTGENLPAIGDQVVLQVETPRRNAIQRHHTVTHLLHWALHEVVSHDASQKGSFVGPDKLTFDFNSQPLTAQQVADVEKLVNERIVENAGVSWTEVPFTDVKSRKDVMQFFGDKYGDVVRVVQIGGHAAKLDGYSMELCGGTHTRATGEIGLFRIVGEGAIAAGVRRIEAIAGLEAYRQAADEVALIKSLAGRVNSPVLELEKKIETLLEQQKAMEKQLKVAQQREASNAASLLLEEIKTINGIPAIIHNLGAVDGDFLQAVADSLKSRFQGVIVLGGGPHRGSVALIAAVTPEFTAKVQAGKIIQQIAPIVGGKGGGKPDNARGGGKDAGKLDEALAKVKTLLG
jgi:alanyl-tRNA synthetase/REP element-mobilizing transposase RayT